ncbi:cytochrome P450 [Hyaloscypha variabilis F]|uniref:Cytochrome P450 n=1 Tax=Hyaloscypha variabilis (strain UAMH 11265 / GT02V1 / F) TaxID=1149755 RepID=A0A2J6RJI0_HYAVF|nr:cytochrome P450 [Hyaloscypha variabilis F]
MDSWPLLATVVAVLYVVYGIVWRLYWSPIAKFPGPKLAAVTLWYEFYYDVLKNGRYMWEIENMHEKYGPIVRINPYELHINDPDYYDEVYAGGGKKRDKYSRFIRLYGADKGTLVTLDHDLHRVRRSALNPFFSKANVRKLEPIIQRRAQKVLFRMGNLENTGQPLNIFYLFSAFTSDVIVEYAFGESHDYLDREDLNEDFYHMMDSMHHMGAAAKQFSWLMPLLLSIPQSITTRVDKGMAAFAALQNRCREKVRYIMDHMNDHEDKQIPTIFHDILLSKLPPAEKKLDRIYQEGQTLVAAGTETTAWTLSVIMFYLLKDPAKLQRLTNELRKANATTSTELEQLPYLNGVVQEGLRLGFGVSHRLPRIAPDETLTLVDGEKTWLIPPGTPVSMSAGLLHQNPKIFPSPREFRPERWINNPSLPRYLVSFSKGSRQCVGINLAYSELYVCLNTIFSRYGSDGSAKIVLFETDESDVELQHDLFAPYPKLDSKGIRVVFER